MRHVIVAVPAETPVTIPEVVLTVATDVLLLLHVPLPPIVLYKTVLLPAQNVEVPVMSSGVALINTCLVV